MTFKEYLNELDPQYHTNVKVKRSECHQIFEAAPGTVVVLKIVKKLWSYRLNEETGRLWTMDSDGNKKDMSCFILVD